MDFIIKGIEQHLMTQLLAKQQELVAKGHGTWLTADEAPGYPCRVSLEDAQIGERVLLLAFTHHDVASPYRASGPIFIRENAVPAKLKVNEIPKMLRHRMLSLRGYNGGGFMVMADLCHGSELEQGIKRLLANPVVGYIHIHNANPGCFNCVVERA